MLNERKVNGFQERNDIASIDRWDRFKPKSEVHWQNFLRKHTHDNTNLSVVDAEVEDETEQGALRLVPDLCG